MTKRRDIAAGLLTALMAVCVVGCSSTPRQQRVEEAIEDGVVTAKVRAALIEDPVTSAHEIKVETFRGRVQLSGYVETPEARDRALKVVRSIEGVKQVRDSMQFRDSRS